MQLSQGQDRQSLLPEGTPPAARARCVRASSRCREEVPSYADCLLVSTPFVPSLLMDSVRIDAKPPVISTG